MVRCLAIGLSCLALLGMAGCTEDLSSWPVSKVITVKTGDESFVKGESDALLKVLEAALKRKGKKRTLTLTSSGELTLWAYYADLTLKLKVKDKQFTGLKKKGNKCIIRNMVDGFPKVHKFKIDRSESQVGGGEGEKVAFKVLCKKSSKYKDKKGCGEGLPDSLWVSGSIEPSWP